MSEAIIYKNVTKARLTLKTSVDLRNETLAVDGAKILYRKPTAVEGEWQASVYREYDGQIYVDFSDVIKFDTSGLWTLWAKLIFADGRFNIGEPVFYNVLEVGDIP